MFILPSGFDLTPVHLSKGGGKYNPRKGFSSSCNIVGVWPPEVATHLYFPAMRLHNIILFCLNLDL